MSSYYGGAGVAPAGSISTGELEDGAVTLAKLAAAAKADWEYAYSGYKLVHGGGAPFLTSSQVVGTFPLVPSGQLVASGANGSAYGKFTFDPALFSAGARATKLHVVGSVATSGTAPGATCTFRVALFPVTASAIAGVGVTTGTETPGSTTSTVTGLSTTGTTTAFTASDFDAPAAGDYTLAVVLGGATTAASSFVTVSARLLARQV